MRSGRFIFSLDFELYWGVHHNRTLKSYGANLNAVPKILPKLSQIFLKYDAKFTIATVGMLLNKNWKNWHKNLPQIHPKYLREDLSPYIKMETLSNQINSKILFQPVLIDNLRKDGHEIASHTYSHFFCLEAGVGLEAFESDIIKNVQVAESEQHHLISIVFPRNQYSDEHLKICYDQGIRVFRGNPDSGLYSKHRNRVIMLFKRFLRFLDSYINITGFNSYIPELHNSGLMDLKASFFLRCPSTINNRILEALHLRRIKKAMTQAAKQNQVLHLWCHPHNITSSGDLNFIEGVLNHFYQLSHKYGFESSRMGDFINEIPKH